MQEQGNNADLRTEKLVLGIRRYETAQLHFLKSIEIHAQEALIELKNSVLPLWAASQRIGTGPEGTSRVYQALWNWGASYGLVEPKDLPRLATIDYEGIWFTNELYFFMTAEMLHAMAPDFFAGFAPESSAVVFCLTTLSRVVACTLDTWCKTPPGDELRWTLPNSPSPFDTIDDDQFSELTLTPEILANVWTTWVTFTTKNGETLKLPPPVAYEFAPVRSWNLLGKENRRDAERRILAALKVQLHKQLDQHEAFARRSGFEKKGRIIEKKHFDWLALFQVKGYSLPEVTEVAQKTWPDKTTHFEDLKKTAFAGIRDAAKLVVGPSYKSWLRPVKLGRPKKRP